MATNRPRGFAPWRPRAKTLLLLDSVQKVLDTYRDSLPLTGRQIFYRLVATTGFDKTEASYKQLLEMLNRARRADMVPMDAIRDDGAVAVGLNRFRDSEEFLQACAGSASNFQLDLLQDQPQRVEVICEAAGMVPQLDRVARSYGVAVRSSGGFDSTTVKHQLGRFYGELDRPAVVLHVGDFDPSGEHIHLNLGEDVGAFAAYYGGSVHVRRVAVTADQQVAHNLPTAPPKPTDKRSFSADFTVQAEALPPDVLAEIVRHAIESELDLDLLAQAHQRQAEIREELVQRLEDLL
jgi:hypothetical protein